jgi:hypothetical protein
MRGRWGGRQRWRLELRRRRWEGGSPLPSPCVAAHEHLDGGVPTVVGRVQQLLQRGATALEEGRRSALGRGEEGGGAGGWRKETNRFSM